MKRNLMMIAPLALAACTATADEPPQFTEKQAQKLEKQLAGKTPGKPVSCISAFPRTEMIAINDRVVLYKVSNKLVYKNELLGSCSGLKYGDALVLTLHSSQYCRGDIAHTVDLPAGIHSGSCALGDFIPYRAEPKG